MKKSSIMHSIAVVVGIAGALALVGAWIAEGSSAGTFLGRSQGHLYADAIILTLISISALICSLIYWHQERV